MTTYDRSRPGWLHVYGTPTHDHTTDPRRAALDLLAAVDHDDQDTINRILARPDLDRITLTLAAIANSTLIAYAGADVGRWVETAHADLAEATEIAERKLTTPDEIKDH